MIEERRICRHRGDCGEYQGFISDFLKNPRGHHITPCYFCEDPLYNDRRCVGELFSREEYERRLGEVRCLYCGIELTEKDVSNGYVTRCNECRGKLSAHYRNRMATDVNYKLRQIIRIRLNKAIKNNQKRGSAVKDLGCSIEYLKKYLEAQFELGMTWNNHGDWHIDHIEPLAGFNLDNREELLQAVHYTNLQPLWAEENLKKSNKTVDKTILANYNGEVL